MNHEVHYLLGNVYLRLGDADRSKHHHGIHERLSTMRQEIFMLERQAGQDVRNVAARQKLVELYEEIGSPE